MNSFYSNPKFFLEIILQKTLLLELSIESIEISILYFY